MEVTQLGTNLLGSLSLTENMSYTYGTTESDCLNFYFDVLQGTDRTVVESHLEKAWAENPLLTLKLIFQLRDIRRGKAAKVEFHYCLLWLFKHHPLTLMENLQHVASHGYWKDLSWLVKFIVTEAVSMTTPRAQRTRVRAPTSDNEPMSTDLEEIVRHRLNGQLSKRSWQAYLNELASDNAKLEARMKFSAMSKTFQLEQSRRAKEAKKASKEAASTKLQDAKVRNPNFAALYDKVADLFASTLVEDKRALTSTNRLASTALCGKWAPTIGCSIDLHTSLGKNIAKLLYPAEQHRKDSDTDQDFHRRIYTAYRKEYLIPLRKAISVAESFMSRNDWDKIEYSRLPSVCMSRNKKHFLKHDSQRFTNYLDDVKAGKKKIASGALLPHEIVAQLMCNDLMASESNEQNSQLYEVAELQWKSYVENLKKSGVLESALAIADVSGSMSGTPMEVSIALSILTAEVSKAPFNDVICSFSATPQLHKINQPTLAEKVAFVQRMDWGTNTNFQAVFDLLLGLAVGVSLPPSEMVKTIFVYSDMEFDQAGGDEYETDYQLIKRKFDQAGYSMPQIVFWNLRGGKRSKPVTKGEKGVALVSGFSGQMLRTFLDNGTFESPYQMMIQSLSNHYDHLKVVD